MLWSVNVACLEGVRKYGGERENKRARGGHSFLAFLSRAHPFYLASTQANVNVVNFELVDAT